MNEAIQPKTQKRRRRAAKFRIMGKFGKGGKPISALVTIDNDTYTVRPSRSQKVYTLPLSDVSEIVYTRMVMAEKALEKPKRKVFANRGLMGGR